MTSAMGNCDSRKGRIYASCKVRPLTLDPDPGTAALPAWTALPSPRRVAEDVEAS